MSAQTNIGDYLPDMSDLTDAEREVVRAVDHGMHSPATLARETDRSPSTTRTLLQRGREKIAGER